MTKDQVIAGFVATYFNQANFKGIICSWKKSITGLHLDVLIVTTPLLLTNYLPHILLASTGDTIKSKYNVYHITVRASLL